jgi:splicing factor 1
MQEITGGAPGANGQAPRRIEAGPGGYDQGNGDAYGDDDRDLKPWQRGPTGAAAPWQRAGNDQGGQGDYGAPAGGSLPPWAAAGRGGDSYGYGQANGGYGAPPPGPPGGAAPWHQAAVPPPPGGTQGYGAYGGYPGGYGDTTGGYPVQPSMGAPPGLGSGMGGLGAPPGLGALFQAYNGNGGAGSPPPPPPPGDAPPPPVSQYCNPLRKLV